MKYLHNIFIIFIAVHLATSDKDASHNWEYPAQEPNGLINEKEKWGGKCADGKRQSPVDLTHEVAVKGEFQPFLLKNYAEPIKQAVIANTGHSIQINNPDLSVTIEGGGLPGTFILDQMHFHWSSEHTLESERYALELHMVHHDSKFPSIKEAAEAKNGIAVLGVLFHVEGKQNDVLDKILNDAVKIKDNVGDKTEMAASITPYSLLPEDKISFFRYEGSLTTPGCGEAVIWTVFSETLPISIEQVEHFKTVHTEGGQELVTNYRSLQPLNSRILVFNYGPDPAPSKAAKSGLFSGFSFRKN